MLNSDQQAAILGALPDLALVLTERGQYAAVLGGKDPRFFHDGSSLVGKFMHAVLPSDKADWFLEQIQLTLREQRLRVIEYGLRGAEVEGIDSVGPTGMLWFEARIQPLPGLFNDEPAVLWVASNITERHQLEEQLRLLSDTDELTGLYNRRKLMNALAVGFEDFRRYRVPTSVFIFDLDSFKRINDQFGHHAGDRAIQTVARVCSNTSRKNDLIARLGGDEFIILMSHTDVDQALQLAERLRLEIGVELGNLHQLNGGGTISGGISNIQPEDASIDDVLKRADEALYQAKNQGRNRIFIAVHAPSPF